MNYVIHTETGFSQEYRLLVKGDEEIVCQNIISNELCILVQGVGNNVSG